jgi:hypothetical protein
VLLLLPLEHFKQATLASDLVYPVLLHMHSSCHAGISNMLEIAAQQPRYVGLSCMQDTRKGRNRVCNTEPGYSRQCKSKMCAVRISP